MTEVAGLLSSLAVPGSAICAAVIGIVALMRLRSADREALSTNQRAFADRMSVLRDEADARADKFRDEVDQERDMRIEAERQKLIAEGHITALQVRVESLENLLQQSHPNQPSQ